MLNTDADFWQLQPFR